MPARRERSGASQRFPIVGIGASAGGLEAFGELIRSLPVDTGMAFVLLQHLRQDAKSMLSEILARESSMPVVEASDGLSVEPNHIYIIPAAADLEIIGGKLVLVPRTGELVHLPIDRFFASLAADAGERAVGVVLSGAGSDGTVGLRAIKSEGGLTFAQDPMGAGQADMPRHAIESGAADFVLTPQEIARELARLGGHMYVAAPAKLPAVVSGTKQEDLLRQVFLILRRQTGMDFSGYKRATFGRRLARRMLIRKLEDLTDYVHFLGESPEEVEALYQDVLIMVTEFFREPETFDYVQAEIFPRLTQGKEPGSALRLWVVGCSSGQEAFSFAMSLLEYLGEAPSFTVQIFGTDINEKDIEQARVGLYPESVVSGVSSERLGRFFSKTAGGYRIKQSVRDLCTFAKHDLTRDPPFSHIDLISCRNVLIYFDKVLQERVAPVFHYALVARGVLLLGRSETMGPRDNLFVPMDKKHHLYSRRDVPAKLPLGLALPKAAPSMRGSAPSSGTAEKPLDSHDVQREADEALATAYAPANVVTDDNYRVMSFRGSTTAYLEHPTGKASLDLFQLAREGLVYQLRQALKEAKETLAPVTKAGVRVRTNGARRPVDVEVTPFRSADGRIYFVISFREPGQEKVKQASRGETAERAPAADEQEADLLRRELEASREHLQSVITEKDVGTEELRAAYEELQSSNEELQSTNEELETAKEELQSINEELSTVNDEIVARNTELSQAHDDLANLLASVNIPIIMLDGNLRLRRYTPGTEAVLHVMPSDIGRHVSEIKPKVIVPDLEEFLRAAIDSLSPSVREVKDTGGRWYSMRVRPSRTAKGGVEGAVLTFIDVDDLKRALESTAESKRLGDALNDIDVSIHSTFEFDEIMRRVMERAGKALGSQTAAILLARGSGWLVRHAQGHPNPLVGTYFDEHELPQAAQARRERLTVVIGDVPNDDRVTPAFLSRFGVRSELVIPLMMKDNVLGVLLVDFVSGRVDFTDAQVDFATKLGASISLALENAGLYNDLLAAEELGAALSDILAEIVATRDIEKSMGVLLEKAAAALGADRALCSFRVKGGWRIGHVLGFGPELIGQPWGAKESRAFPAEGPSMEPLVISDPKDKRLERAFLESIGVASVLLVPLLLSNVLAGILLFGFSESRDEVSAAEKDFMVKLSASVSLGLENSRLFDTEHRLAESLRRRLSPRVPALPGLEIGAVAHMAGEMENIGGDFYEVFALDGDRAAFFVGDVMGKGLVAAELTDVIRASARAVALRDPSPGPVLDAVNRVVRETDAGVRAATGLLAVLDMKTGEMEVAGAGHPSGIVCASACRILEHPAAPPLGFAVAPYQARADVLGMGETLILYTDGLTEARRGSELFGEERLLEAIERLVGADAQALAEALVSEASEFASGELKDDVAVLVIRRSG